MSSPYSKEPPPSPERIDDLMLRDDEPEPHEDQGRTASSVRDIASRIPESLSAIGRDISRTIEKAISAKDDYVVAVKVRPKHKRSSRRWSRPVSFAAVLKQQVS